MNTNTQTEHGKIFAEMLSLRISGYKKFYGCKTMPIDIYDHFSHQLLLSECINGHELFLACVRFVSLEECDKHNTVFLPLARVSADTENKSLKDDLLEVINSRKGNNLYYNSSLTISPSIKTFKKNNEVLKTIIGAALAYHQFLDSKNWLTSAPIKVRTDKLFKRLGYKSFGTNAYYLLKTLNNEKTILLRHQQENHTYRSWLNGAKNLWKKE